ncbi:sensor histidine kinase [Lutibacter sp. TH_r2]|uniref:sensor histidine kinase n=1 Tax=Lutibacter sp. TH_r2 TaxID=3082083 RepID=UPI0029531753|nr:sensor histidine kinase [Lutibacter sp. TH_r2]MDV7186772.1 sensor histidine kinase [Lutibacter sp. TH_r2]
MSNTFKTIFFILLIINVGYSQNLEIDSGFETNRNYLKIEDFIIDKNIDSALYYVDIQKTINNSDYLNALVNVVNKRASYSEYYKVGTQIYNRNTTDLDSFKKFMGSVPTPNSNVIELDYVYLNWLYVSKLRNHNKIDDASKENERLENYVNNFDEKDENYSKSKLLIENHHIVLLLIEKQIIEGKQLCLESLKLAKELNDTTLQIIFLNHLCDFLIYERDLDGYIENIELSLSLESNSDTKSPYYFDTLKKLIDAYMYKGNYEIRVNELLEIMYSNPSSRLFSYSLYANFLRTLDTNSPLTKSIFKKFDIANSYIEFCKKIETLSKNKIDSNEYFFLIDQNSQLLEAKGYLKEAILYKTKAVNLTRKIYSEDLSNSLANYKTEQVVKEKELEINYQKEKTKLYGIIAILGLLLLSTSLLVIARIKKQSKVLKIKNLEIQKQRDALEIKEREKDLLLKEVHHRVKNNFQIVSSLLELQTKGIEDEKALELANEGKNRVKSMALIHQKLYQNENGLINFDDYIKLLVKELTSMYATEKNITTKVNSENMMFDVDTAIPLGLIINELITNSYKYAFNEGENNELNISINKDKDDYYKLIISDNGPGLNEKINLKKVKSLGLRLVNRLVKQLQGKLHQNNTNGAYFEVLFKDTNLRRQID